MKGHDMFLQSSRREAVVFGSMMAMVLLTLAGSAGCSDHRISLSEFMAMQQVEEEVASTQPSTQPALDEEDRALIDRELGPARVGQGDIIAIIVMAPDTTVAPASMQVRVDRKGEIHLPVLGAVKVAGLELEDVEARLQEAYVPKVYADAAINVNVVSPETTDVLVTGSVGSPGLVKLRRTERNLLQAMVAAGGVSQLASGEVTLRRLRQPDQEVTINLLDPVQLRESLALAPLERGDLVEVHAATPNTVFVGGLVNQPGPQPYLAGTRVTVLQALAAASGLRTDLTPREATLIRRMNGKDVHVKLDLDKMTTAKDPNITLAAGDVLWVPYTVETRIQEWINKNVFLRTGASATYNLNYSMNGVDYLNSAAERAAENYSPGNLQDSFDPFGFLLRNQSLQNLQRTTPVR